MNIRRGNAPRAPQDIVGGILLVLIALLALYLVNHLPATGRVGFASGTAPRLFAYGLAGLGLFVAVTGWLNEGASIERSLWGTLAGLAVFVAVMLAIGFGVQMIDSAMKLKLPEGVAATIGCLGAFALLAIANGFPRQDRFGMQGPVAILGSVVLFAVMIRTFGLVVSGVPMVILASAATADFRWKEAIVFSVAITGFCALLFPIALGQPIPLWPQF